MSFVIDNAKVDELLASSELGYAVTISSIDVGIDNYTSIYPNRTAGGTIPIGTREHLLALRRKIETSGIPLVSTAELDSEIREMRR